jgi:hypothetical protein
MTASTSSRSASTAARPHRVASFSIGWLNRPMQIEPVPFAALLYPKR